MLQLRVVAMDAEEARRYAGLCADCQFLRLLRNERGSGFYQCGKSFVDSRFAKYPRLPVRECPGYAKRESGDPG